VLPPPQNEEAPVQPKINVVVNFTEELTRRVPTD
jgi:hypothetical protein